MKLLLRILGTILVLAGADGCMGLSAFLLNQPDDLLLLAGVLVIPITVAAGAKALLYIWNNEEKKETNEKQS